MIKLLIVFGVIGFAVAILLNIFFTYIPIANIENKIDIAAEEIKKVTDTAENIENSIIRDAAIIGSILSGDCSACNSLPEFARKTCMEVCNKIIN